MDEWVAASERISRHIHTRSTFILVAKPEALVVKQAQRLVEVLKQYDIILQGVIINRVINNADSHT